MRIKEDSARRLLLPVYVLLTVLLCLPFLTLAFVPLVDYPNHLARSYVLMNYARVPLFQAAYWLDPWPICNLMVDLVVPWAASFIGLSAAGKLFLVLLVVTYAAGCYLLAASAWGGPTWLSLIPLMFVYNSTLIAGFVNYYAGVALYLLAFAVWLQWKDRWTFLRALAFSGLATACYFAHITSIGFLGVSILAVTAQEYITKRFVLRQFVTTMICILPAVVLYIVYARHFGHMGAPIRWNTLKGKLIELLVVIRGYDVWTDIALAIGMAACLVFVIAQSKKLSVSVPLLVCGCVLMLGYVIAPLEMLTGSPVDGRFVWPALVLLSLSVRPRISPLPGAACLTAFVLMFLVRADLMWWQWRDLNPKISRMARLFDQLPRQSKMFVEYFSGPGVKATKLDEAVRHVPCYAMIDRDAYIPTLTAIRGQQQVVDKHTLMSRSWTPTVVSTWDGYDYVWTYKPPPGLTSSLLKTATPVASADESTLWRINAPQHLSNERAR